MTLKRAGKLVTLLALIGLVSACGDKVTVGAQPSPLELFQRVQQFLAIATMLFNEGQAMWGHGLRNVYYAALTLARFKDPTFYAVQTDKYHQHVWAQSPKRARQYFRDNLRALRVKYDYRLDWPPDDGADDDLREFGERGPAAFAALLADAHECISRRYRQCAEQAGATRAGCQCCDRQACARQAATNEIASVRLQLERLFEDTVPGALLKADDAPSEDSVRPST